MSIRIQSISISLLLFSVYSCYSSQKKPVLSVERLQRRDTLKKLKLKEIFPEEPRIKVGIDKSRKIQLRTYGICRITDSSESSFVGRFNRLTFYPNIKRKSKVKHWVILQSYLDEDFAKAYKLSFPEVKILKLGIYPRYFVAIGPFDKFDEALRYKHPNKKAVFSILQSPASGYIKVKELGKILKSPVRVSCKEYKYGNNRYKGDMIIMLDDKGLVLINDIKIEEYLKGVVPWEMSPSYPLEALKAQTIAARTHAVDVAGIKWYLLKEPYDITDDFTTQVYKGLSGFSVIDSVVDQTRGMVMMHGDKFCIATFFTNCGGLLESGEEWGDSLILPKTDAFKDIKPSLRLLNIKRDTTFACSPRKNLPTVLSIGAKSFRWIKKVRADKIRRSVRRNFGVDVGRVMSIKIVERSESGRVKKILIVGSRRSFKVRGDWNIRVALGGLKSSLFYMRRRGDVYVFKGGGWGHGIGMCQVGAGVRALKGWTYEEILMFYYGNVEFVKLW